MKTFLIFLFTLLSIVVVEADQSISQEQILASPWEYTQGGKVRLLLAIPKDRQKREAHSSTYRGAIEIDLNKGWKTYWRNPGTSGMAASFNILQNVNLAIFYPAPQVIQTDNDWSFGYQGRVVIPFEISHLQDISQFSGSLMIGMCQTMCMPVEVAFDFRLDAINETGDDHLSVDIIKEAWDLKPENANKNFEITQIIEKENAVIITLHHPLSEEQPELFLDGGLTEFGLATIEQHKDNETIYRVPVIYRSPRWDKSLFYTAKGIKTSVSGTVNIN